MSNVFPLPPLPKAPKPVRWRQEVQDYQLAQIAHTAPVLPWDRFIRDQLRMSPGEHVALIAPTGAGKTHLLINLLPFWQYITVFATKPVDETMDRLVSEGYLKMTKWRSISAVENPRRVLWPPARNIDADEIQRKVFTDAFDKIFREGGWAVALDELGYVTENLGLGKPVRTYLMQGRSLGISLIAATQRPSRVPLEIYDQSTHLFFGRDNDEVNLKRIGGFSVHSSDLIRTIVSNLHRYQWLYMNTRTGQLVRTTAPITRRVR